MSGLMDALLKARKNMDMPPMNGVGHAGRNGAREYKYATLQDVLKCVMPPLMEQGVFLTQGFMDGNLMTVAAKGDEQMVLDKREVSTSGTPQEQGSAETYAKRYALCTVFCIAGLEDDDGSIASAPTQAHERVKAAGRFDKVNELKAEAISIGISEDGIKSWIEATFHGKSMKDFDEREIKLVEGYIATLINDKRELAGNG